MKSYRSMLRSARGWIGATTAAAVVMAGAAACAGASAQESSSGSAQTSPASAAPTGSSSANVPTAPTGSSSANAPTAPTGSSSANDPHAAAAQREADRILTTFQPPLGAVADKQRPDPVPPGLEGPPTRSAAQTQATAVAWYSTSQTPDQVLSWVQAHRPAGSSWSGSSSGSVGPDFVSFAYPTPHSELIVTPASGPDGRTVIRLDASVVWTPSRGADTQLGYAAPSVTVVTTNTLNPHIGLPADETTPVTATSPLVVHQVVDLLNALQPEIPSSRHCAADDGTQVRITLPNLATAVAVAGGCGDVTVTPADGPAQHYAGGDLIPRVYALFGITWSRTGGLPPGTERTGAFGLQ